VLRFALHVGYWPARNGLYEETLEILAAEKPVNRALLQGGFDVRKID
jgi:hypothetical protein